MSEDECGATHEIVTYRGPLFDKGLLEMFRCIRERDHDGNYHLGPPIDRLDGAFATWLIEEGE